MAASSTSNQLDRPSTVASGSGANGSRNDFDEGSLDELLAGWAVAERIVVARRTDSTG